MFAIMVFTMLITVAEFFDKQKLLASQPSEYRGIPVIMLVVIMLVSCG